MDNQPIKPEQPTGTELPPSQETNLASTKPEDLSSPIHTHEFKGSKKKKLIIWIIMAVLGVVLLVGGCAYLILKSTSSSDAPATQNQTSTTKANSFEECVSAGGTVQESFPARCSIAGDTFVQQVDEEKPQDDASPVDPTLGWKTFAAKNGSFSVRYPFEYLTRDCSDDGNSSYFGAADDLLAICNSGKTGQIYFGVTEGDSFNAETLKREANPAYEKSYTYEDVTVSGKPFVKTTTVTKSGELLTEDTKIVTYDYVDASSQHFTAAYQQQPNEPDNIFTFELMVSTWKLN